METLVQRLRNKWLSDKPWAEWRLPIMLLTVSGVVFILITALFGVSININTKEIVMHLSPGDDWSQPMINKDWEDYNHANPMQQFPWWLYFVMVMGYFSCFCFFTYAWFRYMRWRWKMVPEFIAYHKQKIKKIKLTQGKFAIVDEEDYNELNQYKWHAVNSHNTGTWYANRSYGTGKRGKNKHILMHQEIMGFPNKGIDHINRNGLDNRKSNLRICSISENLFNSKLYKNNKSGFKGITWNKSNNKWRVKYGHKHLGYFEKKEDAIKIRKDMEKK
jgi:hypothetical protein